jgi:cell division septum initiation protein DivIVA
LPTVDEITRRLNVETDSGALSKLGEQLATIGRTRMLVEKLGCAQRLLQEARGKREAAAVSAAGRLMDSAEAKGRRLREATETEAKRLHEEAERSAQSLREAAGEKARRLCEEEAVVMEEDAADQHYAARLEQEAKELLQHDLELAVACDFGK